MTETERLNKALRIAPPKRRPTRSAPRGGAGPTILYSGYFRHGITLWYVVRILDGTVSSTVRSATEDGCRAWLKQRGVKARPDFDNESAYDLYDRHFPVV
jgi:hypothetical protein